MVKCDSEGENTCKSLCNALATATKAKGPEVLCNRLKNANELKVYHNKFILIIYSVTVPSLDAVINKLICSLSEHQRKNRLGLC